MPGIRSFYCLKTTKYSVDDAFDPFVMGKTATL